VTEAAMDFVRMRTWTDFERWRALTAEIYAGAQNLYVPPVKQALARLFARSQKPKASIAFVGAQDAQGRLRARATLHSDAALDDKLGERVQLFGFAEFADDPAASECLLRGVRAAAAEDGRRVVLGPANLLPNEYGGVITSGFGARGFLDSAYNPPYYPEHYRRCGFAERFASATYVCDRLETAPDPEGVFAFDDARLEAEGLNICYGDKRRIHAQIEILRNLLNACFADRPYYTPIALADMYRRMDGLAYIMDERLLLYLTRHGEPIGFAICLPDISRFLIKTGGDLGFLNQLRLLAARRAYRSEAVFIVEGVTRPYRGKGYLALMTRELFRNLIAGGYREVRGTYVEKDNPAAAAQFLKMGGRVLHDLTFFELRSAADAA
jgi:hypothetical protein